MNTDGSIPNIGKSPLRVNMVGSTAFDENLLEDEYVLQYVCHSCHWCELVIWIFMLHLAGGPTVPGLIPIKNLHPGKLNLQTRK